MDGFSGDLRVFIGVTLTLGGLGAFAAGRAVARSWRPVWLLALYALPLTFALRFLQWSLFGENIGAPLAALLAFGWVLLVEAMAWRLTRAAMMRRQYPWTLPQGKA